MFSTYGSKCPSTFIQISKRLTKKTSFTRNAYVNKDILVKTYLKTKIKIFALCFIWN